MEIFSPIHSSAGSSKRELDWHKACEIGLRKQKKINNKFKIFLYIKFGVGERKNNQIKLKLEVNLPPFFINSY